MSSVVARPRISLSLSTIYLSIGDGPRGVQYKQPLHIKKTRQASGEARRAARRTITWGGLGLGLGHGLGLARVTLGLGLGLGLGLMLGLGLRLPSASAATGCHGCLRLRRRRLRLHRHRRCRHLGRLLVVRCRGVARLWLHPHGLQLVDHPDRDLLLVGEERVEELTRLQKGPRPNTEARLLSASRPGATGPHLARLLAVALLHVLDLVIPAHAREAP